MAYTEKQQISTIPDEKHTLHTESQANGAIPNDQTIPDPGPHYQPNGQQATQEPAVVQTARSRAHHDTNDPHLPTILFAIPFPAPKNTSSSKVPISPYLIYALPRAPYQKPEKDENGKNIQKEGVVKKFERKWQEEIAEGDRIQKGEEPDAGAWKKFKGKATGTADKVIHWLPNSRIEALARVPPKRKLGELTVLFPADVLGPDGEPLSPEQMQNKIGQVLKKTQKRATLNAVGSACLLPVTATIDLFAVIPIFLFEMNLAYFVSQVAGRSKVSAITHAPTSLACVPTANLSTVSIVLQATCYQRSSKHFENPGSGTRGLKGVSQASLLLAADALIDAFEANATEDVKGRHVMDRRKVAEDLGRCCRKAAKEYVKKVAK